jgi:hypothetical protein
MPTFDIKIRKKWILGLPRALNNSQEVTKSLFDLVSASYKQASPILYGAFCLINYQYIFVFRPWREARDPKVEYLHY